LAHQDVMTLPRIIQGGMGVAISDWNLANAVSRQGCLGVVSGTGLGQIMISRLMEGDLEGHVRRALEHFPFQDIAKRVVETYHVSVPSIPRPPYKRLPMWTLHPSQALHELTVVSSFVEVFLAKEGHSNPVGINLLEKLQFPTMTSLYGAMLAGVDFVFMGAGIPVQVPGILDRFTEHKECSYRLDVRGADRDDDYRVHFDPQAVFPGIAKKLGALARPCFVPIISSVVLAKSLIKRASGRIDGFIIEMPVAGGHNAPPRDANQRNEKGEPVYGAKDVVDLSKIAQLGLPFWLAGGYDSPEKMTEALAAGATGIQVGTAFAYCDESGMDEALKSRVLEEAATRGVSVRTDPAASPTGFPFKVLELAGTQSEREVYDERVRLCDIGMMRQIYKREDGKIGYRCSSEPAEQYLAKGGKLEDMEGTSCLCNTLPATAGYPQRRKDGYTETPLVTAGDGVADIGKFAKPGRKGYTAKDVLEFLAG